MQTEHVCNVEFAAHQLEDASPHNGPQSVDIHWACNSPMHRNSSETVAAMMYLALIILLCVLQDVATHV